MTLLPLILPPVRTIPLTDLPPHEARQEWETLHYRYSVEYKPLRIGVHKFASGIGTHADSSATYILGGRYTRFRSWVGLDAEVAKYKTPAAAFEVYLDGRLAYESGVMGVNDPAKDVDLSVAGVTELTLVTKKGGKDNYADHVDWGDASLTPVERREVSWAGKFTVRSRDLKVRQGGPEGELAVEAAGHMWKVRSFLEGAALTGSAAPGLAEGGAVSFRQRWVFPGRGAVDIRQVLQPAGNSVAWTLIVEGDGLPWSCPVVTSVEGSPGDKIWMATGGSSEWHDPFGFWPARSELFTYGKMFNLPNGVSLPLASLSRGGGRSLSISFSPRDMMLAGTVVTTPTGALFSRDRYRMEKGHRLVLHMMLAATRPDALSSLAWMHDSYPEFFRPPNPKAGLQSGLGAYSGHEEALDAAKYQKMGFAVNWKASLDFPYMGMFLPPVPRDVRWNRFAGGGSGEYSAKDEGRYGQTSIGQMEAYNRQMERQGFHVLNYFNVTEFGGNMPQSPPEPHPRPDWHDPAKFLYGTFPDAVLRDPKPDYTWGNALVMDCGDLAYRNFLLGQVDRQVESLPSAAGICIDRMDWLSRVNPHADDRVTWQAGPARSLVTSWRSLMGALGARVHTAGKVIYVNDLWHRLDLMRDVDGVYDEYGYDGGDLDASAFMCLDKPLIAWTASEENLRPDPDAYFQRHLLMGAFPTAPVAGNDHCIGPSAWADKQYLAYGPLFKALKGREWLLDPDFAHADGVMVNAFKVPGGYAVAVVFAGPVREVRLRLKLPRDASVEAWLPDEGEPRQVKRVAGLWHVPIARGCAVLTVRRVGKSARLVGLPMALK